MNEAPFPATADPGRTFPALSYDSARAALVQGITERRGLLCLVGEAGTGKTLLLRTLLEAPPPGVRAVMLLQPGIEFEALVEFLALQLGRPAGTASSAGLDGLRTALAAEAEAGRDVLLLVEEAQALPSSTLAGLPELIQPLTGSGGSAMQVLLAGQPPLLAALRAAGLRTRVAVIARLERLAPSDVAVYVHGRLAHAGAPRKLFTPGAVARIARLTEGVPRRVNMIADASLTVAWKAGARPVTEEHVSAAWESYAQLEATPAPGALLEEPVATPVPASAPPPVREALFPPPTRTTTPRPHRAAWALVFPAGALAAVLFAVVVARAPSGWHWGAKRPPSPVATASEARRVAAAPPRQPAREPLPTPGEALDAVDAFRRAYEARDAAAVEGLLALDATQGGTGRLAAIAPDVRALDRLEDVAYLQPAAQVEARGPAMEVRTSFEIRYRDRAGHTGALRGTAVWQVARRDGTPRIVGLSRALAPGSVLPHELAVAKP